MADFFLTLTVRPWMRKHIKALKASVFFRKESRTTTLTKSKPSSHVLSTSAMFNDLLADLCKRKSKILHHYY